jgi:hypothetical protein
MSFVGKLVKIETIMFSKIARIRKRNISCIVSYAEFRSINTNQQIKIYEPKVKTIWGEEEGPI